MSATTTVNVPTEQRSGAAARSRLFVPPVAASVAALAFIASGMIRKTYPFGDISRNTNDLGQQFIPMHAYFRDVLTGQAPGDLTFNWAGGFGVPFLGDVMAYLGSTLSWIVLIFPRDRIDLALYTIAVTAIAIAAAVMAAYLRYLRPTGSGWLAVAAGVSYSMCGWAVDDAAYMTVWLTGLIAFPTICLLGEWILRKRSLASCVIAPPVIALLWTSHFYTVYMATIGAGIVILARVLSLGSQVSWRHRLTGLFRCLIAVLLGIGLAAPLLVPTYFAVHYARPSPEVTFKPIGWLDFSSRLLTGTEGVGLAPGLAVGTLMLLLAVSFPVNREIAVRERIVWTTAVLATVLSMQIGLTHVVWHGFDSPNGSPFRQAFVIAGMLVVVGWLSATAGLRRARLVIVPLVFVAALYAATWDVPYITTTTRIVVPIVAVILTVVWFVLCRRPEVPRWIAITAAGLVLAVVGGEAALSAVAIDRERAERFNAFAVWNERDNRIRAMLLSAVDWPRHRVTPSTARTANEPMLLGGQGPQYYSSTIPNDLSEALAAFGFGYTSYGRAHIDPRNPVVDAVFSIGARVVDDGTGTLRLDEFDPAPLATLRRGDPWRSADPAPYGPQETALGADVYTVPELTPRPSAEASFTPGPTGDLMLEPEVGAATPVEVHLGASCPAGAEIYLAAPMFVGAVLVDGASWESVLLPTSKRPGVYTGAPMRRIGVVGPDGVVDVSLQIATQTRIPQSAIGCLERDRLDAAIGQLKEAGPAGLTAGGHHIDVELRPGTGGTLVIGVVRSPGWRCTAGDQAARTPETVAGLIAVRVAAGTTDVSCSYRPRGLSPGIAIGFATLGALAVFAGFVAWRGRRTDLT